jgi:hypothetical protein
MGKDHNLRVDFFGLMEASTTWCGFSSQNVPPFWPMVLFFPSLNGGLDGNKMTKLH